MLFIKDNNFKVDPKLSTIFNKIHNKLHNIHYVYSAFHYKNYYRNFKIIKVRKNEKKKIAKECKNIENIDINIFSSDNNINEILDYCNNDDSENILENIPEDEGLKKQHAPDLVNQKGGSKLLNNLTDLLMNSNYEAYISNIKSNITDNISSSQVFDKLSEITKACVKNYYNKSL